MADYIKREDALKIFSTSKENWKDYEAAACIAAIPAADAVEVVRCKDCRHLDYDDDGFGCCEFRTGVLRGDGFCEEGLRNDDERLD